MTLGEVLVIVLGLAIGYWIVSTVLARIPTRESQRTAGMDQRVERDEPLTGSTHFRRWHDVLNVSSQAGSAEIRHAYRTLMSQYHPDKVESLGPELKMLAERKAKEINQAYREAMQLRGMDV